MPLAFRNAVNNSALDLMGGLGDPDLTATPVLTIPKEISESLIT